MAKTLIDIDEKLLADVAVALGTRTKRETVEAALTRILEDTIARRRAALADLRKMADDGLLDFEALDDMDR